MAENILVENCELAELLHLKISYTTLPRRRVWHKVPTVTFLCLTICNFENDFPLFISQITLKTLEWCMKEHRLFFTDIFIAEDKL